MKSLIACITVFGVLVSSPVLAKKSHGYHDTFYDYGRVIRVKPVYYKNTHHSHGAQCYRHEKRYNRGRHQHGSHSHYQGSHHKGSNTAASTVTGAVVGGVVGNVLASNSKKRDVATVAGAVIGGVIGHELAQNNHSHHGNHHQGHHQQAAGLTMLIIISAVTVRNMAHHHRKIKGYNVTYRYKGEKFKAFTHHHPGNRIRIQVQVTPAVYN